jgi:hypothetical protein
MKSILGDNLLVYNKSNGTMVFNIDDSHEMTMSSYEMATFIYALRLTLSTASERDTIRRVVLQEKYKKNGSDMYESAILIEWKDANTISIGLEYSKMLFKFNRSNEYNNNISKGDDDGIILVTIEAPLAEIDDLINTYMKSKYSQLRNNSYDDEEFEEDFE